MPPSSPLPSTERTQILQRLFGEHHGWLFGRLRARLGCRHDAADIASETFTQVVALSDPGAIREPRALLTTIAKRLIYTSWRRRDLERAYLEALALQPEATHPSPEDSTLALEALVAIDELLDGLSPKARAAFLYSQLEGLTYTEIARRLDISVTRVHQYVVKGLTACYLLLDSE